MKLTLTDACAIEAILVAAQRKAVVAKGDASSVVHGTARYVGGDPSRPRDFAAETSADIRDMFLVVRIDGYGDSGWLVRDLIARHKAGTFVTDFDLAAWADASRQLPRTT